MSDNFIEFHKYSGAGNDFIVIDNRIIKLSPEELPIQALCSRKKGIGADGILLIESSYSSLCKMRIFNADGSEAEMCGNGLRCIVDYLYPSDSADIVCEIESKHRNHKAWKKNGFITIDMGPPTDVIREINFDIENTQIKAFFLNTGVPHAVVFCNDVDAIDLEKIAPKIRYHAKFGAKGTNVNFVQVTSEGLKVRTYERGVEAETEACGTGATASAIAAANQFDIQIPVKVYVRSQDFLLIDFKIDNDTITKVTLSGPCNKVFVGKIDYSQSLLTSH